MRPENELKLFLCGFGFGFVAEGQLLGKLVGQDLTKISLPVIVILSEPLSILQRAASGMCQLKRRYD